MNRALAPGIWRLIEKRVKSGRYATADEVILAAMTSLDQHDHIADLGPGEIDAVFPGLREKLAHGLADAKAGRLSDGEAFFDELEAEDAKRDDGLRSA